MFQLCNPSFLFLQSTHQMILFNHHHMQFLVHLMLVLFVLQHFLGQQLTSTVFLLQLHLQLGVLLFQRLLPAPQFLIFNGIDVFLLRLCSDLFLQPNFFIGHVCIRHRQCFHCLLQRGQLRVVPVLFFLVLLVLLGHGVSVTVVASSSPSAAPSTFFFFFVSFLFQSLPHFFHNCTFSRRQHTDGGPNHRSTASPIAPATE